ncbi:MAG: DDE-type integrase/transposase/recombinase [Gammaproteobacteria bacterium]|nr:DDE-type integrase/transposase/recombinase [Gammaproteobacteria bacterium]
MTCDASGFGIGGALSQKDSNGSLHPIAYASRVLNKDERKYSVPEREALAIVWAIKHFRAYLYGRVFSIATDHKPHLQWLMRLESPSPRSQCWSLLLQEYNIRDITYTPGPQNRVADCLSRNLPPNPPVCNLAAFPGVPLHMKSLQREDSSLLPLIDFLETGILPEDTKLADLIKKKAVDFHVSSEGVLFHSPSPTQWYSAQFPAQIVIPHSLRSQILELYHCDVFCGHSDVDKTFGRISLRFFWETMRRDIIDFIAVCLNCRTRKGPHSIPKEPLVPLPAVGAFDRVSVDVLGPLHLTLSGNKYIVCFTDALTKWPEVFATPETSARTVAELFVNNIICRHGCPLELLSDNAKNFRSNLLAEICKLTNTNKTFTTPYHPAGNGQVERYNHTLVDMLSMFVSKRQDDWDEILDLVVFAYRTAIHSTTKETPAFLLYGRDLRQPSDLAFNHQPGKFEALNEEYPFLIQQTLTDARAEALRNVEKSQTQQKAQHDKNIKPREFNIGDWVFVHTPPNKPGLTKKLLHSWHGPYEIVEISRPNVTVKLPFVPGSKPFKVHLTRVKPAARNEWNHELFAAELLTPDHDDDDSTETPERNPEPEKDPGQTEICETQT